jgi:hypothetical protein
VQWWNKLVAESCYIMESHFFGRNVFKMKAGERMESNPKYKTIRFLPKANEKLYKGSG